MHILELPSFFPPHGGEFCLEQAKALQSLGHQVRVLACTQLAMTVDGGFYLSAPRGCWWDKKEGVECYCSYLHALPKMVMLNQQRWVARVMEMYDDYRHQFGRPDVIHAHCAKWAGVAALQISRKEGIPYFITEHLSAILHRKDFGEHWERDPWAKDLIRQAMMEAKCVIPVSRELVEELRPFFGDSYRYHVISNIVDVDYFDNKGEAKKASDCFRWVCLARADVRGKGYDLLAEAIQGDWLKEHNAQLHIAGRDTESLKSLFPQKEVMIHGNLDKKGVRELLWQSDALVLPTRGEAQPLVLLEAVSSGIPVVTTEAVPRSVLIEGASIVVPVGDSKSLAHAMEQGMKVKPDREWVDKVRMLASPQSVAKQLEQLFAEK